MYSIDRVTHVISMKSPPLSQTKVFESQLEAFCLDRIITLIATQSHYRQAIYSQPYSGILSAIIARRCFERLKSVMNTAVDSVVSGGDEVFYDSEYVDRLLRQKMNEITIQVLREKSKYSSFRSVKFMFLFIEFH